MIIITVELLPIFFPEVLMKLLNVSGIAIHMQFDYKIFASNM